MAEAALVFGLICFVAIAFGVIGLYIAILNWPEGPKF